MTPSNMLNKKKSLPLIYALENSPVAAKRELSNIYVKRVLQPEDVSRIISILDEANARQFAEEKIQELSQEALASLAQTAVSDEGLTHVRDLTQWALEGHG